jgi:hypothetical protein
MQIIIAPTDFLEVSLNAVNYAADMAVLYMSSLLIVHSTELLLVQKDFPRTLPMKQNSRKTKRL